MGGLTHTMQDKEKLKSLLMGETFKDSHVGEIDEEKKEKKQLRIKKKRKAYDLINGASEECKLPSKVLRDIRTMPRDFD